jgi:hypothetical protein
LDRLFATKPIRPTSIRQDSSNFTRGVEGAVGKDRPFGEVQSAEEPYVIELDRADERGRGRRADDALQIPWRDGTTSSGAVIGKCSLIACCPSLAAWPFSSASNLSRHRRIGISLRLIL